MEESEEGAVTMIFDQEGVSGRCRDSFRRRTYILKGCKMEREEEMDKIDSVFTEFGEDSDKTNAEGVGEQVQSKCGTLN